MDLPIVVRPARTQEHGLVYKTWLLSFEHQSFARAVKPTIYRDRQRKLINGVLACGSLLVATTEDDPETVLGWAALEAPDTAHYVFVKEHLRRFGVAKKLLSTLPSRFRYSHRTYLGEAFIQSYGSDVVYDPYAAFKCLT